MRVTAASVAFTRGTGGDIWGSGAYAEARERIANCDTQCMYLCYEKTDLKSLSTQVGGVVRNFMTEGARTVRHRLAS